MRSRPTGARAQKCPGGSPAVTAAAVQPRFTSAAAESEQTRQSGNVKMRFRPKSGALPFPRPACRQALALLLAVVCVSPSFAGPLEDGIAAFHAGDYPTAESLWR